MGPAGVPVLMYTWDVYLKVEFTRGDLEAMGLGHDKCQNQVLKDHDAQEGGASKGKSKEKGSPKGKQAKQAEPAGGGSSALAASSQQAASCTAAGRFLDGASLLGSRLLHRDMRHWDMAAAQIGDAGAVAALLLLGNHVAPLRWPTAKGIILSGPWPLPCRKTPCLLR